ncbi:MAG TPA: hypothetical protein VKE72_08245 [Methylocella sp.]|nr:hypothetical protein [Methylocella sp.]
MTNVTGSIYAAVIGAAVLMTAAPASALVSGSRGEILSGGHENLLRKAVYAYELYDDGYNWFYDDENYCWQQVWTDSNGWRWVDVCHGYAY